MHNMSLAKLFVQSTGVLFYIRVIEVQRLIPQLTAYILPLFAPSRTLHLDFDDPSLSTLLSIHTPMTQIIIKMQSWQHLKQQSHWLRGWPHECLLRFVVQQHSLQSRFQGQPRA